MKKFVKSFIASCLACAMIGTTGCYTMGVDSSSSSSSGAITHTDLNVWTAPSVLKPLRDQDYSEYYTDTPVLEIDLAKNEYESAQIMITPKEDVKSYTLEICDLTDSKGNVIEKENINVYNQHYVELTIRSSTTSGRPLGYYPDALIPQHLSEKKGENNIGAGSNQAICIDVYAPEDAEAGLYTGTFKLTVDSEKIDVPVQINVRDFVMSSTNHVQSSVYLFWEYLMGGELDNTPEMYEKYVDFLLDYRVCTDRIVFPGIHDEELLIEKYKKYAADERVSSYSLFGHLSAEEDIRLLIENSTPEVNLIKKLMIYCADEPYGWMDEAKTGHDNYIDLLIEICNSYTDEQLASWGVTRDDILGVEVLATVTASVAELEGLRTYAPLISDFNTETQRAQYDRYAENAYTGKNGELEGKDYGTTWWYSANLPREPWPNYHIDREAFLPRVISWMQYDYDIDGVLYWCSAAYFNTDTIWGDPRGWESVNIYESASSVFAGGGSNGEGYMLYPGARYGEAGPLPSVRLLNIRDGFEDYENLLYLETEMEKYIEKYNLKGVVDFEAVMRPIYDSLYTGVVANTDYRRIIAARDAVMDMIELLASDAKAIIVENAINVLTNQLTLDVYAEAGSYMMVDGQRIDGVQSGNGVKLSYTYTLEGVSNVFRATIVTGDKQTNIEKTLCSAVKLVNAFESADEVGDWEAFKRMGTQDYITLTHTAIDATKQGMHVQIDNGNWSSWELTNFVSGIRLDKEDFFGEDSFKDVDYIQITLYNAGPAFQLDFRFEIQEPGKDARSKSFYTTTIKEGWNTIKIPYVSVMKWTSGNANLLDKISGIILQFEMIEEDIDLYIENIFYTYAQ